jgi:phospholipid/cholesterol/gamma-HCH transport system permease protein
MAPFFTNVISSTGQVVVERYNNFAAMGGIFLAALKALLLPGKTSRASLSGQFSRQLLYTGVEAMGLVSIIAFICGSTIVMQAMTNMTKLGVSSYFGDILVIAVVRELGPFFTSIVVIGRSGAALAAHIGTMRENKEVAALQVMGIDPVCFLVVPALAGMVGSMVCLNVYFDLIAIVGGLIVGQFTTANVPIDIFIGNLGKVVDALSAWDIIISVSKSAIFGCIIAVVSCHYGLRVRTIRGVPQAAIKAVVGSMVGTILVNVAVTVLMLVSGLYAR